MKMSAITCPNCKCKFRPVYAKKIDGEMKIDTGRVKGSSLHGYKIIEEE
jgi:hypothetical protein